MTSFLTTLDDVLATYGADLRDATPAQRVAAGSQWLDANIPDWVDRVVLYDLDMTDCDYCVLGQVFDGGFEDAVGDDDEASISSSAAEALGFDIRIRVDHGAGERRDFDSEIAQWDDLQALWEEAIKERRSTQ